MRKCKEEQVCKASEEVSGRGALSTRAEVPLLFKERSMMEQAFFPAASRVQHGEYIYMQSVEEPWWRKVDVVRGRMHPMESPHKSRFWGWRCSQWKRSQGRGGGLGDLLPVLLLKDDGT